jgi:hypothetical protein
MCDEIGMKGMWAVRRLLQDFYRDVPDPPPIWDESYDKWVRVFGKTAAEKGKFDLYQGWDHRGPLGSGIPPEELEEIIGDDLGKVITALSVAQWRRVFHPSVAEEEE